MFKIEKGIPIPVSKTVTRQGRGRDRLYPWAEMQVGDSFFVPGEAKRIGVASHASAVCKRYAPKRFVSRKVEGGVRIWRVE